MASTTTTSNQAPPSHVVNFGCGHPDASLLPLAEVAAATQRALLSNNDDAANREWLQYARENGNLRARQALADFLTHLYYATSTTTATSSSSSSSAAVVDPDTLCITSGVSHGIQLTCRTLWRMHQKQKLHGHSERPLALVEDPTYFLVPAIFQQSGYEIRATLTTTTQGLDVAALEKTVQELRTASSHRLIVLYTIPVHHNPLGVTLSPKHRQELVEVCEQYNVFIIADEVYQGLGFPSSTDDDETGRTTSMVSPAAAGCSDKIISVSAFTKILCPGIRCGWIQTHNRALLAEIGKDAVLDSGGCSSQLSSGIVTHMIHTATDDVDAESVTASSPLVSYMISLQTEYAKRCHHVCQLLQEASQTNAFGFEFSQPQGGYFLWVTLTGTDFVVDEAFRGFCLAQYHVDFKTGRSCSSATWQNKEALEEEEEEEEDEQFSHSMRLCFAYYDVPTLTKGVERLCQAIQDYSKNPQRTLSKRR